MVKISRVESIHQLRGVLCSLHVNSTTTEQEESAARKSGAKPSNNIIDWMINEKDNQPPHAIVVIDLVDIIVSKMANHSYSDPNRYLHLPYVRKIK